MTDADPQTPPNEDGLDEGGVVPSLLPPFLLVQAWEPDAYDEVLLEWWGEGYLMECGSMHADARLAEHDHGRILALVVVEEDWVEECREIAGVTSP